MGYGGASAEAACCNCSILGVMPGLVPGIHVLGAEEPKDVDGRDKPGHDVRLRLGR